MSLYNELSNSDSFFLVAGPCVIEDISTLHTIAERLVEMTSKRSIPFVFKASFTKANRTSVHSYAGPGLTEGLAMLAEVKAKWNIPILTDVHETCEVNKVAEVADILQIPAFLARQTYLLQAAAKTGKLVNIKKGQFMSPVDMKLAAEKVSSENNYNILLTERGTCFGYHDLVVDFRSFAQLSNTNFPVIYDVTHSLQKPSVNKTSGGTPEYVPMMAKAALATGYVDGLFIETHPHPLEALSDASSMYCLDDLPALLDELLLINTKKW